MARDVVVTGYGLVSASGEGAQGPLAILRGGAAAPVDGAAFAPIPVHPAPALELDRQIPKKSDQRQMEPWQRLGVYAAGLALDHAGAKDDAALKARMHLIVAAGGGERDYAVDGQILTGIRDAAQPGVFLNERLMGDVRPTLFLAQLSNLLAGNIAIVHGVTGASRTFMGEESAGVEALRIARARIASGQNDIVLVGGSYNAERPDSLLIYEMGGFLWKQPFRPVLERPAEGGGMILGSGGAFVLLEARDHAAARGATALATLAAVASTRGRRAPGSVGGALRGLWREAGLERPDLVLSGASGVAVPTAEEAQALAELAPGLAPLAIGDALGHTIEMQAPAGVALAAAALAAGDAAEVAVTGIGHWRGEGLVRLTRA